MSLHVSVHNGADDGSIPLVLLHGFGGSHRVWDAVRNALGNAVSTLALDLPGHGDSLNADGRGGAGRMAKAIHVALEDRDLASWHLAGHSMGGAVAALIALRAPNKSRSLTLVAPGGMTPAINAGLLGRFASVTGKGELAAVLADLSAPDAEPEADVLEWMHHQRCRAGALEALQATYSAMFPVGPEKGQGVIPHTQLAGLTMPVSVLWGSEDQVLPCPLPGQLPDNFSLTVLAGHGHMLPETAPEETAVLLRQQAAYA